MRKTVVILVDHKKRDFPGCALIAHYLGKKFNIRCELQPLESWRSCLAAFKPNYILFNHVTAGHLAKFSNRLKEMGILVGALPNEGLNYNQEVLAFNAGKYHQNAHIDHYFCWNKIHGDALLTHMKNFKGEIHVVGIPRFDYYFYPWKNVFNSPHREFIEKKPRILVCTNFGFARFKDLPKHMVDKFFSPFKDRISTCRNYWELIEVNARSRDKLFDYLKSILEGTDCFIDLKPHPRENHEPYLTWFERLSLEHKKRVTLRLTETIFEVLPFCDIEISCESCTTALEAWILGKPTIELVFERHPAFFNDDTARCNRLCDSPDKLPDLIKYTLENPEQEDLKEFRRRHLSKWCASPSGDSSFKVAQLIANALEGHEEPKWDFTIQDWKRAIKLKVKNSINLAYGSNPWKLLTGSLPGQKMNPTEAKFIRPSDVKEWEEKLKKISQSN